MRATKRLQNKLLVAPADRVPWRGRGLRYSERQQFHTRDYSVSLPRKSSARIHIQESKPITMNTPMQMIKASMI